MKGTERASNSRSITLGTEKQMPPLIWVNKQKCVYLKSISVCADFAPKYYIIGLVGFDI